MVWIDGKCDMVAVQEEAKYDRKSGVDFGPVDVIRYAEAFGAVGIMIHTPEQILPTLEDAFAIAGLVLIGVRVDYRDNHLLFEPTKEHLFMK
ncbi:thiamine pyrophosphate-dependent enzyme [Silvibacterium sp.]|uniref:thiamine pyrophosphate-dependent enzyme n=1 Tax=Silvibacterium sp. TaxID=1964179 RepID=UPI0039E5DF69